MSGRFDNLRTARNEEDALLRRIKRRLDAVERASGTSAVVSGGSVDTTVVVKTSSQTTSLLSNTTVTFQSTGPDTLGATYASDDSLLAPTDGIYLATAAVELTNAGDGQDIDVRLKGAGTADNVLFTQPTASPKGGGVATVSHVASLSADDGYQVELSVNDGSNFDIPANGRTTNLALTRLEDTSGGSGSLASPTIVKSGSVTLSSGVATIDTGVATTETATFNVYLGPSTDDAELAADIRSASASGNYEIGIQETDTSVGNPSVEYDITRVR